MEIFTELPVGKQRHVVLNAAFRRLCARYFDAMSTVAEQCQLKLAHHAMIFVAMSHYYPVSLIVGRLCVPQPYQIE